MRRTESRKQHTGGATAIMIRLTTERYLDRIYKGDESAGREIREPIPKRKRKQREKRETKTIPVYWSELTPKSGITSENEITQRMTASERTGLTSAMCEGFRREQYTLANRVSQKKSKQNTTPNFASVGKW
jgi:hypothetical protein